MNLSFRPAFAALALAFAMALPATAEAAPTPKAVTTRTVTLRAGPDTAYEPIARIPAGSRVRLYGCLRRWTWCDVSWQGIHGWVAGRYLEVIYRNRPQILPEVGIYIGVHFTDFFMDDYWGRYYRDRPWYRDRHHRHDDRDGHDRNRGGDGDNHDWKHKDGGGMPPMDDNGGDQPRKRWDNQQGGNDGGRQNCDANDPDCKPRKHN